MNSSVNHSQKTNKSTTSHEALPSEQTINQSDVKQNLSQPTNGLSHESNGKLINESSDTDMAKELYQKTDNNQTLAVMDTKSLDSAKSQDKEPIEIDTPTENSMIVRQHPIAPPSEPKQYRAIGLVRGCYQPSTEQFTRGNLRTSDGSEIDAVLLGRVMSLLKNHIDLQSEHLWVVYPRTRQENNDLHIQIMGVWEPETLTKVRNNSTELTDEEENEIFGSEEDQIQEKIPATENIDNSEITTLIPTSEIQTDNLDDGYFSIRGEVIYQSQEEEYVIVKVQQSARKGEETPKFFKLKLKGHLGDRPLNRFWDLHIQRQNTSLVIQYGNDIGSLFLNNRRPYPSRGKKIFKRNNNNNDGDNRRNIYPKTSHGKSDSYGTNSIPIRKEPLPKPTKRNKKTDEPNN
ncbi:hypothetical protein [Okeania sp.]|uniref:hypothetical protein n=1 Tax=Okeania sp. TaxID=3100323 RepID=UPI002B4B8398|nr:hypothetical protein [Okeania sp.]MEB3339601.1 hypothetical protein [Okeania sp.]